MDLGIDLGQLQTTLRAHGVGFALVFGSHASGHVRDGSDLDLAVWAELPLDEWRLVGSLPDVVDLVDLRWAPEGLAGRIALTGVVVLDDDARQRIRWQATTRKRHLDEAFRRQRFQRDFVRAHG